MIEVKVCENWSDVNNQLYHDSWNNALERYRSPFVFRALSNNEYKLDTTLMRLGGPFDRLETHLIHSFRKYAHEHIKASDSMWDWLVLARHHGLPTRLLDWTYSPYVALHFATEDLHSQHRPIDSVIWCVDYKKTHKLLPGWLKSILQPDVFNMFTVDMLSRVATDLQQFDTVGEPLPKLLKRERMFTKRKQIKFKQRRRKVCRSKQNPLAQFLKKPYALPKLHFQKGQPL